MNYKRPFACAVWSAVFIISSLAAHAQTTSNSATSAENSSASKQSQKTQKKAESKARRAQKNAELSELEKSGYNPAGKRTDYPEDIQNAQRKADAQRQSVKPASSP